MPGLETIHAPSCRARDHKFCQTNVASVKKQLKFFLTVFPEPGWQTACCSHTALLSLRNSSNLAGLQASCRRLHVEMIPSRQDYGRPFRSGEYDTHAWIWFGYLTQQTLPQATGEIALKHQQRESWPVPGGKYGSRMKRPKCHRWHHQWGIYTIKYYLQKKKGNITIRRGKVLRNIPSWVSSSPIELHDPEDSAKVVRITL